MMNSVWFGLGVMTVVCMALMKNLSARYRLTIYAWGGMGLGMALILFCIAWGAGSVLEGVPRAAAMGVVFFGFPGIVLVTVTLKYIDARLEKITPAADGAAVTTGEDSWPHFDLSHVDLPHIPIPIQRGLSRLHQAVDGSLRYVAWASLIAAYIIGMSAAEKDYETMVKKAFPYEKLTKINDDPVVFEVGAEKGATGNYIVISEGQGYGGPFVVGVRIKEDAKVHQVMLLDNRETPGFRQKIEDANFPAQFEGKHVGDDFLAGVDIDMVSGASITTMAGTEAIRKAAHIAATQHFKLDPDWMEPALKFGLDEILIIAMFVLAFIPAVYARKPWSLVYLAAGVVVIGFYLNASISIASFGGLLLGFIPSFKTHLTWYFLVLGTIAAAVLLGKNTWCFRVCPFYGVQYVMGKIGGGKIKPSATLLRRSKFIVNFLLWLSLMAIFLSRNPGLGSYEPFAMMFSLTGTGIQWFILPLALIGSFFMSAFWCRFFCPCGHFLTHVIQIRRRVIKRFQR